MSKLYKVSRLAFSLCAAALAACGGGSVTSTLGVPTPPLSAQAVPGSVLGTRTVQDATPPPVLRHNFLGAFFRAVGPVPYGVFAATSPQTAPSPYPAATTTLFGAGGYCDAVAKNGVSISSGYVVDHNKITNVFNLGVKWAREVISSQFDDASHLFGPGRFMFADTDSAQCALVRYGIAPIISIEAGPVEYNQNPSGWAPALLPTYKTAADFASFCGAVAAHEAQTFTSVTRYSIPGNEVNSNPTLFPGGAAQVASYTAACYKAIKAAQPNSVVYGFELNMSGSLNPTGYVQQMAALGCKTGTCYDALSIHLYFPYPVPASTAPCFPNVGGNYTMQCVTGIQTASGNPALHVLIGETAFMVPSTVPSETAKATAVLAAMNEFALNPYVDGVNYANVDECGVYPTGYFSGGCLINTAGTALPAFPALQWLAFNQYE